MIDLRKSRAVRQVRAARLFGFGAAAALALAAAPVAAQAFPYAATPGLRVPGAGQSIADFYMARGGRPLWLVGGRPRPEAMALLTLLDSAELDGLDQAKYRVKPLAKALRQVRGRDPRSVQRAEAMLSAAFVAYAQDLRRAPDLGTIYVDPEARPTVPSPRKLLDGAAAAPSLEAHIIGLGWMHPTYGELRRALASGSFASTEERRRLVLNLERARALPGANIRRHVLVNAAAQRLYMYENGRVVDWMRVVVGKPANPTPMMAAMIRFTSLNPYWNVPSDLAAERIAPNVLKGGMKYLAQKRYQVLSDWSDKPKLIDPREVDWKAVAAGQSELRMRQLPGPANAMGKMKFMFPNKEGIYLHDTPDDVLFNEASRLFSGGCVRLQHAPRLGEWLHGRPLKAKTAKAEQRVDLPEPVPVYLTYLTAVASGSQVVYYDDIYGRDAARVAVR